MKDINQKKNYIWNTIAGVINASEAVILLAVVTRTNGMRDAGILTIAFAIANLLVNIGKYGMRWFQVTDLQEQYSFNTYFTSRIFTSTIMIFSVILYIVYEIRFGQYNLEKASVIFFICLIFVIESIEDIFAGLFQKNGRLDIAGIVFSVRWIVTISVMIVVLFNKKNLLMASVFGMMVSVIICILLITITFRKLCNIPLRTECQGLNTLLRNCTSLFIAGFLQFYLVNASKYAIDRYLTDEIQACYGFVAMPVFVIELLNSFLYQPILVQLATQWKNRDIKRFNKQIWKQLGIITIITAVCLVGAEIIGIPVLSILYHTKLDAYKSELMILLVGGGFLAVIGFATVLLTTMRKQNWILYLYMTVSILVFIFTGRIVKLYATIGASYSFLISTGLLAILLLLVVWITLKQEKQKCKIGE